MSKPDKPIFNQQGGRGKLYGPTHGATYMGTYQMPDGKMDRRVQGLGSRQREGIVELVEKLK